jgi:hypothetical protein
VPRVPVGRFVSSGAGFCLLQLGETEVEDLDPPVLRDEQVLGLEIPVDDALLVGGREPPRDLDRVVERLARRQRPGSETAAKGFALQELGDDVRRAVVGPDVVDRRDVRVVQESRGSGLLLEAAEAIRVRRERRRQDLDRDVAAEARILRAVDLAHPSRTERRDDLIGTQTGTGGERHFSPSATWR